MSSKSKTLFQGLPKCSQVPAGEVSSDSVPLALSLKMRAMGCLIPQCVRPLRKQATTVSGVADGLDWRDEWLLNLGAVCAATS